VSAASKKLPPQTSGRVSGWIGVAVVAVYLVLVARLFQLQVLEGGARAEVAEKMRSRPMRVYGATLLSKPARGAIRDRDGRDLAVSHYEHRLAIEFTSLLSQKPKADAAPAPPKAGESRAVSRRERAREELAAELPAMLAAAGLRADAARVPETVLERGRSWGSDDVRRAILVRRMSPAAKRALKEAFRARIDAGETREERAVRSLAYGALAFEDVVARTYPYGELTAQVLGVVGGSSNPDDDRVLGRTGVERQLDALLTGACGSLGGEQTCGGARFKTRAEPSRATTDGVEVELTIDVEIQRLLYAALKKNAAKYKCLRASAVVLDASSGEILGIGSIPTTEPGDRFDPKGARLGAVEDSLEPGSTIKPLYFAYAFDKGRISGRDDELFDCGGADKTESFQGRVVRDYSVNPRPIPATEVLYRSSNVGATRVAVERLGLDGLYRAFDAFRLAERPGSGLLGEAAHAIRSKEGDPRRGIKPASVRWEGVSFAQGYSLRLSPLALATAYTTFATGGERLSPTVFREIRRGEASFTPERGRTRVLSKAAVEFVKRGMTLVIEHPRGTAHASAKSDKYVYFGKTGTSQFDYVRGVTDEYNAWMAAVAPAKNPRIVVVVVHHKVNVGQNSAYTGGAISGPVVRDLVDGVLERLGVSPDRVEGVAAAGAGS
jgi:cell division protein FtsI (penicillin-binding protein 3)